MKKIQLLLGILLTAYAVWFNLDLYKLEPTATTDPNDNNFQFALVDRANTVWDFASRECGKKFLLTYPICHMSYMVDHWVPNWAEGYNLPFYYSHWPQIAIVGSYRFFHGIHLLGSLTLFQYYHQIIYLLLCLFPITVFFAVRIIGLNWFYAGIGAIFASQISTDGFYGLDPPSFLWRGWGLSSQLYAMIFMPLGVAYVWKFLHDESQVKFELGNITISHALRIATHIIRNANFWFGVIFLALSVSGHLGIGYIALISAGIMSFCPAIAQILRQESIRTIWCTLLTSLLQIALVALGILIFLGYWIIPAQMLSNYHNYSYWDPIWKFNSYGWIEVLIRLFDGNLFDFGRFQWMTLLVFAGVFLGPFITAAIQGNGYRAHGSNESADNANLKLMNHESPPTHHVSYFAFSVLFLFWVLMYFGRTTWGNIVNIFPGMSEFHLSRFTVGIHLVGLFLVPIGLSAIIELISKLIFRILSSVKSKETPSWIPMIVGIVLLSFIIPPVYAQTSRYNELNNRLIIQANTNAAKVQKDIDALISKLKSLPPGRVYAGRGGTWGKNFKIAETELFMYLSNYGIPTVLWLPETWSPNSDVEQYFSEDQAKDYDIFNIRYVAAPPTQKAQSFWKQIAENPSWILYEVDTTGYFAVGTRNMAVVSGKTDYVNVVRLWIQSTVPTLKLFPQIAFSTSEIHDAQTIPVIRMTDEVTYLTGKGVRQNIWANNPIYGGDPPAVSLVDKETIDTDMIFKTTVKVERGCRECMVILKQSYHPSWKVYVDGRRVQAFGVFPFFIGIPVSTSGVHDIVVKYEPSNMKLLLLWISVLTTIGLIGYKISPFVKNAQALLKKKYKSPHTYS